MNDEDGVLLLKEQNRAFTRRRLIGAARVVFTARGYPDATIDEIAHTVGASRATFYTHFIGKGAIAGALLDDILPFAVSRYQELDILLQQNGPCLREQVHGWLSGWLDYWADDAVFNCTLYLAGILDSVAETHLLRVAETMIDSLEWYLGSKPEAERGAARSRLLVLEIMTQQVFASASNPWLPIDKDDAVKALADIWFDALAVEADAG
jgi:AcrR family transcriptional regulator